MLKRNYYYASLDCINCKSFQGIKIKKAITVEDHFKNNPEKNICNHCKCKVWKEDDKDKS